MLAKADSLPTGWLYTVLYIIYCQGEYIHMLVTVPEPGTVKNCLASIRFFDSVVDQNKTNSDPDPGCMVFLTKDPNLTQKLMKTKK